MAVYRCEVKRISRSSGRSSVAAAAYRAADRLHDERTATPHDYRRRAAGVAYAEVVTPQGAPLWAQQRGKLWNAVEAAERRKDANTAREVLVSLPHELDDGQRVELVRQFSSRLVERYGVAVDMAVHRPDRKGDQRNHHAHLMMTTRRMDGQGFTTKTRELDDRTTGPKEIEAIRALWEQEQNLALTRAQSGERVSRLSNSAQGIDREPEPKIGKAANAMMRRGEKTRRGDLVEKVREKNRRSMRENMAQQAQEKRTQKESYLAQRAALEKQFKESLQNLRERHAHERTALATSHVRDKSQADALKPSVLQRLSGKTALIETKKSAILEQIAQEQRAQVERQKREVDAAAQAFAQQATALLDAQKKQARPVVEPARDRPLPSSPTKMAERLMTKADTSTEIPFNQAARPATSDGNKERRQSRSGRIRTPEQQAIFEASLEAQKRKKAERQKTSLQNDKSKDRDFDYDR